MTKLDQFASSKNFNFSSEISFLLTAIKSAKGYENYYNDHNLI